MNDKYNIIWGKEDLKYIFDSENKYSDSDYKNKYYEDYWKKILDYQVKVKTQEEIWQEQLEKMDISVVERFLRKKKLERIS